MKNLWIGLFFCVFAALFPARAETVSDGFVMKNTRYQTPYWVKKGAQNGPTVVVIGGVHGDEPASFLAARQMRNWRVEKGTLVLMPDAHIEAIRHAKRGYPRNMNALFPGKANGDAMERLAFQIWGVIRDSKPDLVLTLHESRDFYVNNLKRYGQTFTFDFEELRPQFGRVAQRLNARIPVKKNHFLLKVEAFKTCPTYCAWRYLRVPATSIETSKTLPLALRIQLQKQATLAFLEDVGLQIAPL